MGREESMTPDTRRSSAAERGVSAVELLTALALVGLVLTMGVSAFKNIQPRLELQLTAEQVAQDLALARLRAIERRVSVQVHYDYGSSPRSYQMLASQVTPATVWFRRPIPASVALEPYTPIFPDVTYNSRGFLDPPQPVTIILTGKGTVGSRTLVVSSAGRVRLRK
jgi:Tfp pilus assembly protein FimT